MKIQNGPAYYFYHFDIDNTSCCMSSTPSLSGCQYHNCYGESRICNLCARSNDLADFELCSSCCYALAQAQEQMQEPDSLDNFIGLICRKLGVGTLPVLLIVAEETWLTHLMHHFVFLPTPVGYELMQSASRAANSLNAKQNALARIIRKSLRY